MKIGILQTGVASENLVRIKGDYPSMFACLLGGHGFEFQTWRVLDGEFPKNATECDGWLITGSRHGVYEDHPWIKPLEDLIRSIYAAERPMVGICFGHQIIAQALGGHVEKFKGGWCVGATQYLLEGQEITLNAWHQDQVITLPKDAQVIAQSDFCANAALLYGNRAFTIQAHPEFCSHFIAALIEDRGKGVLPDDLIARAQKNLHSKTDSTLIAARIAAFFKAPRQSCAAAP